MRRSPKLMPILNRVLFFAAFLALWAAMGWLY